jgi:Tol biopolymer transport system component
MKPVPRNLLFLILLIGLTGCPEEETLIPAELSLGSLSIEFGSESTSETLIITNLGEEPLEWSITTSEDWITVNPTSGTTSDLVSEVTVEVDRTGKVPANYQGTLSITTNGGDQTVTVGMDVVYMISKIAFTRDNPNNYNEDIFIMNTDGTGLQQLTQNSQENVYPSWSPDGEYIYFSSDRYNNDGYDLFRMAKNGTSATQLTNGFYDIGTKVSPDGTRVLFGRLFEPPDAGDYIEIFIMNPDGSDQIQLTNNRVPLYGGEWSRDGTKIIYASAQDGDYDIYSMDKDGFNQSPITQNEFDDYWPSVAVNNKIVFISDRDGDEEIFIMNSDGSNVLQLTNNEAYDWDPCCSRTEEKIVFVSDRDGDAEIFVMNLDGTGVIQLTQNDDHDYAPNW